MSRPSVFAAAIYPYLALVLLGTPVVRAQQTIHIPADRPTIQAGIDAASPGDTVVVAPNLYFENIDFQGKAITVQSSDGPFKTIIDGSLGQRPAVLFTHHETLVSTLLGFTIQNGGAEADYKTRGGILVDNSSPTLRNNIITHNHCYGVWSRQGSPAVVNNVISATLSNGSCGFAGGSGVWLQDSLPSTNGVQLRPNFFHNILENNVQSGQEAAGGNGGAGIAVWGGSPVIQANVFRNNRTFRGTGGGINVVYDANGVVILHNLIFGNEAGCGGGGLAFHFGTLIGPGAAIDLVENNTIVANTTNGSCGFTDHASASQIYVWQSTSQRVFVNNIIVGTTAAPAVADDTSYDSILSPLLNIFDHNLIWNPQGRLVGGNLVDPTGQFGNISADPLFANSATNDFHLALGSPAIDTGNNSSPTAGTIDGNIGTLDDGVAAPQDATGKGYPVLDMGAYEVPGLHNVHATLLHLLPSSYQLEAGFPITLNAELLSRNGIPTGTVTFLEDGKQVGVVTADANGQASLPLASLLPGLHTFLALYPGQGSFTPSTSVEVILLVNRYVPVLTLTTNPSPSMLGKSVAFTATITSPDNATLSPITFTDNGSTLATVTPDANGVATLATTTLTVGTHLIVAFYSGDPLHAAVQASVQQQVTNGFQTATTISSVPNPAAAAQLVKLVVVITNQSPTGETPTGTVSFTDGNTVLATVPLTPPSNPGTAEAAFSTSTLSVGSHTVTATYVPTGSFVASFASLTQVITGQSTPTTQNFTLTTASPNLIIKTEHHARMEVSITTSGSFADSIHLSCGNLPEFASCTFKSSDITTTADPNITRSSTLTIDTDAVLYYASTHPVPRPFLTHLLSVAFLLPVTLLGGIFSGRRYRSPRLLLAALVTAVLACTLNGCSGKYPGHTAPGTYAISITGQGRASGLTHTAIVTLNVSQ